MAVVLDKQIVVRVANRLGLELLPDNSQWTNRFHVRSATSNKLYVVAQRKSDGSFGCDCMGWKRYRHCKHLNAIQPVLEAAAVSAPVRGVR